MVKLPCPNTRKRGGDEMEPTAQVLPPPQPFVPADALIDVEGIDGKIDNSLLRKVQRLVADYPDRALEVIRGWMMESRYH